jgi:hypothetical protein
MPDDKRTFKEPLPSYKPIFDSVELAMNNPMHPEAPKFAQAITALRTNRTDLFGLTTQELAEKFGKLGLKTSGKDIDSIEKGHMAPSNKFLTTLKTMFQLDENNIASLSKNEQTKAQKLANIIDTRVKQAPLNIPTHPSPKAHLIKDSIISLTDAQKEFRSLLALKLSDEGIIKKQDTAIESNTVINITVNLQYLIIYGSNLTFNNDSTKQLDKGGELTEKQDFFLKALLAMKSVAMEEHPNRQMQKSQEIDRFFPELENKGILSRADSIRIQMAAKHQGTELNNGRMGL